MSNATTPAATCQNIVERRSGAGITTGAGERSGKYEAQCGRPVVEGTRYCQRCTTTRQKSQDRAHARYHARLKPGQTCFACEAGRTL